MNFLKLPALLAVVAAGPAEAQTAAERDEVLQPIVQLFDGMRKRDSAMVRAAFAPQARLGGAQERNGQVSIHFITPDDFARVVGSQPAPPWDERIYDPEVRIDGRLATVWVKYDFLAGDSRYKRSLSNRQEELIWVVVQRPAVRFAIERGFRRLKAHLRPEAGRGAS